MVASKSIVNRAPTAPASTLTIASLFSGAAYSHDFNPAEVAKTISLIEMQKDRITHKIILYNEESLKMFCYFKTVNVVYKIQFS